MDGSMAYLVIASGCLIAVAVVVAVLAIRQARRDVKRAARARTDDPIVDNPADGTVVGNPASGTVVGNPAGGPLEEPVPVRRRRRT